MDGATYEQLRGFIAAWGLTQPRLLALCLFLPWFNRSLMPGLLRFAFAAGLGVVVAPALLNTPLPQGLAVLGWLGKELILGALIGFGLALPLWAVEAVGFFIDNQRGASIAATLNPITGNDSSPLGQLFNLAFATFVLVSGGLQLMLGLAYDSFLVWPVAAWAPQWPVHASAQWLSLLDQLVRAAVLLSAPVIVAMFLAELGLALVSRFAPQLQVFFLAMPIKSGLALFVLVLYMGLLLQLADESLRAHLHSLLPFLKQAV